MPLIPLSQPLQGLQPNRDNRVREDIGVVAGRNFTVRQHALVSAYADDFRYADWSDFVTRDASFLGGLLFTDRFVFDLERQALLFDFGEAPVGRRIGRWTTAFVGGLEYWAAAGRGLWSREPRANVWTQLDEEVIACTACNGRLIALWEDAVAWSSFDDGWDIGFTNPDTGAGAQALVIAGRGAGLALVSTFDTFYAFTQTGLVVATVSDALIPFRCLGTQGSHYAPINGRCVTALEEFTHLLLTRHGFMLVTQGQPLPTPWEPQMSEFLTRARVLEGIDVGITYVADKQELFVHVQETRGRAGQFSKAYTLYVPNKQWGSFDRPHTAVGDFGMFGRGRLAAWSAASRRQTPSASAQLSTLQPHVVADWKDDDGVHTAGSVSCSAHAPYAGANAWALSLGKTEPRVTAWPAMPTFGYWEQGLRDGGSAAALPAAADSEAWWLNGRQAFVETLPQTRERIPPYGYPHLAFASAEGESDSVVIDDRFAVSGSFVPPTIRECTYGEDGGAPPTPMALEPVASAYSLRFSTAVPAPTETPAVLREGFVALSVSVARPTEVVVPWSLASIDYMQLSGEQDWNTQGGDTWDWNEEGLWGLEGQTHSISFSEATHALTTGQAAAVGGSIALHELLVSGSQGTSGLASYFGHLTGNSEGRAATAAELGLLHAASAAESAHVFTAGIDPTASYSEASLQAEGGLLSRVSGGTSAHEWLGGFLDGRTFVRAQTTAAAEFLRPAEYDFVGTDTEVTIGAYRLIRSDRNDRLGVVQHLTIGGSPQAGDAVVIDYMKMSGTRDYMEESGQEDWGAGAVAGTAYRLNVQGTIDGEHIWAGQQQVPEKLLDNGASQLYTCEVHGLYHLLQLQATAYGEALNVKHIELAGIAGGLV